MFTSRGREGEGEGERERSVLLCITKFIKIISSAAKFAFMKLIMYLVICYRSIVKLLFSFVKCPGCTSGRIASAENNYRMQCFYWTESRHWHIAWYTTPLRGIINLYGRHVYAVKKIIYPNQDIVPRGSHFTRNEQHYTPARHKWHFLIAIRKLRINIAYDSLCISV